MHKESVKVPIDRALFTDKIDITAKGLFNSRRLHASERSQTKEELEALIAYEAKQLADLTQKSFEEVELALRNGIRSSLSERLSQSFTISKQVVIGCARQAVAQLSCELLAGSCDDGSEEPITDLDEDLKEGMKSAGQHGSGGGRRVIRSTNSLT